MWLAVHLACSLPVEERVPFVTTRAQEILGEGRTPALDAIKALEARQQQVSAVGSMGERLARSHLEAHKARLPRLPSKEEAQSAGWRKDTYVVKEATEVLLPEPSLRFTLHADGHDSSIRDTDPGRREMNQAKMHELVDKIWGQEYSVLWQQENITLEEYKIWQHTKPPLRDAKPLICSAPDYEDESSSPWGCKPLTCVGADGAEVESPFRDEEPDSDDEVDAFRQPISGDMIVFPVEKTKESDPPFAVGKVLERKEMADGKAQLVFQLYGNASSNLTGTYRPGWYRPRDKTFYWRHSPVSDRDVEYTSDITKAAITDWNVCLHSFRLTKGDRLPNKVWKHIIRSPWIDYSEQA